MTNDEVLQYFIDHCDKTYPSLLLALAVIVTTLQSQVSQLEEGIPSISSIDGGTF